MGALTAMIDLENYRETRPVLHLNQVQHQRAKQHNHERYDHEDYKPLE